MARNLVYERLAFAVRFAQTDLGSFRQGDWMNLREDLANFTGIWGTLVAIPVKDVDWQDISQEALAHLQAEVRQMLEDPLVADAVQGLSLLLGTIGEAALWGVAPSASVTFTLVRHTLSGNVTVLCALGDHRDIFLTGLIWLLMQVPHKTLVRCPACGIMFVKRGKQAYCSRACVNRVAVQRWRQRQVAQPSPACGTAGVRATVRPAFGIVTAVTGEVRIKHRTM